MCLTMKVTFVLEHGYKEIQCIKNLVIISAGNPIGFGISRNETKDFQNHP